MGGFYPVYMALLAATLHFCDSKNPIRKKNDHFKYIPNREPDGFKCRCHRGFDRASYGLDKAEGLRHTPESNSKPTNFQGWVPQVRGHGAL